MNPSGIKNRHADWLIHGLLLSFLNLALPGSLMAHGLMVPDTQQQIAPEFPPIVDDIDLLSHYGRPAQLAGKRLVEQGEIILPQAHAALSDPASPLPQKMQLITVLGEVAQASSVDIIIDVAKTSNDNRYLYQNALLALANFEPDDDIREFVNSQLQQGDRDPLIKRSAMAYYARQPHPDAVHWVEKYSTPSTPAEVRFGALYLGGMLGLDWVKPEIVGMLPSAASIAQQYYLLMGLVEVTDMEEFRRLTENLVFYNRNREKIESYLQFRKGDPLKREALARTMLEQGDTVQKRAAIKYLIGENKADALVEAWRLFDGFVRSNVKRAGYEIDVVDGDARFVEMQHEHESTQLIAFLLVAMFLAIWIAYRMRRS